MQTFTQKDRFIFSGTVSELRKLLQSLPQGITLREFISMNLH
jgi:hypothetical protein